MDDIEEDEDDENAIIDVEDYKVPPITVNSAIPSTQTSTSISQSVHQSSNGNGSTSTVSKNRIGRPSKSSLSSPVSSSTTSDDERLSPDSGKVR